MKYYIKFLGKFTDLIPNGWEFCKLYARNYRQYSKSCDGEKYGQKCRIWQHLGGYLELDDLGCDSYLVAKQIQDGKISEWASQHTELFSKKEITRYYLYYDENKHRIFSRNSKEGIAIKRASFQKFNDYENKVITKTEWEKFEDENYYREFNLRPEMIDMIRKMLQDGWIEVAEDNRKY
jgi:hypothetical protein